VKVSPATGRFTQFLLVSYGTHSTDER